MGEREHVCVLAVCQGPSRVTHVHVRACVSACIRAGGRAGVRAGVRALVRLRGGDRKTVNSSTVQGQNCGQQVQ